MQIRRFPFIHSSSTSFKVQTTTSQPSSQVRQKYSPFFRIEFSLRDPRSYAGCNSNVWMIHSCLLDKYFHSSWSTRSRVAGGGQIEWKRMQKMKLMSDFFVCTLLLCSGGEQKNLWFLFIHFSHVSIIIIFYAFYFSSLFILCSLPAKTEGEDWMEIVENSSSPFSYREFKKKIPLEC